MAIYAIKPHTARAVVAPDGSSQSSPTAWTDFCTSGTSASLEPFAVDGGYDSMEAWFVVSLTAGTTYTAKYSGDMDPYEVNLDIRNMSGTVLASQQFDDEEYAIVPATFTPSTSGLYLVRAACAYGYGTMELSPRPQDYSNVTAEPWQSAGGLSTDCPAAPVRYSTTNAAGIAAGYTKDGLVFWADFSSLSMSRTGDAMSASGTVTKATYAGNRCAQFDESYLYASSWSRISGSAPRTVSQWINTTHGDDARTIYFGTQSGTGSCWSFLIPNGEWYFQGNSRDFSSGVNVADGRWHHLLGTYDGTNVDLYLDGTLVKTSAQALNTSGSGALKLGNDYGDNHPYTGYMAAVRIYDRVLSASEIASLAGELRR